MTAILLIAFIGMVIGFFLIFGISPLEFTDGLFSFLTAKPNSLKSRINEATQRKKPNIFRREIMEAQEVLRLTNRTNMFSVLCVCSLGLSALGVCVAILMGNAFLVPVMAVGLMFVPFWYIKTTAVNYKKDISAELETALSIVTSNETLRELHAMCVDEVRKINGTIDFENAVEYQRIE